MQREIEVKFLNVDHEAVRSKLQTLGAKLEHPSRLMRRTIFDYPDGRLQRANWGHIRVRDEGNKVTLSYKSGNDQEYSQEVEVVVDSYDKTLELMEQLGLEVMSFQESKRETWQYQEIEVVLDEWPWLNPYIEIEGPSESAIKDLAVRLGFGWGSAKLGNVDTAYRVQYSRMQPDETIGAIAELRFDMPLPKWLKDRQ